MSPRGLILNGKMEEENMAVLIESNQFGDHGIPTKNENGGCCGL